MILFFSKKIKSLFFLLSKLTFFFIVIVAFLNLFLFLYLVTVLSCFKTTITFSNFCYFKLYVFAIHLLFLSLLLLVLFLLVSRYRETAFLKNLKNVFKPKKILLPFLLLSFRVLFFFLKKINFYISNNMDFFADFYGLITLNILFSEKPTSFLNWFETYKSCFTTYKFKWDTTDNDYRILHSLWNVKNNTINLFSSWDNICSMVVSILQSNEFYYFVLTILFLIFLGILLHIHQERDMIYELMSAAVYGEKLQQLITAISSYNWTIIHHNLYRLIKVKIMALIYLQRMQVRLDAAVRFANLFPKFFTQAQIASIVVATSGAAWFYFDRDLYRIADQCIFIVKQQVYNFYLWRYGPDIAYVHFNADWYNKKNPMLPENCTQAMYEYYSMGELQQSYVHYPIPNVIERGNDIIYLFKTPEEVQVFLSLKESLEQASGVISAPDPHLVITHNDIFLNVDVPLVNLEVEPLSNLFDSESSPSNSNFYTESTNDQNLAPVDNPDPFNLTGLLANLDTPTPLSRPGVVDVRNMQMQDSVVEVVSPNSDISNSFIHNENTSETQSAAAPDADSLPTPESAGGSLLFYIGACVVYAVSVYFIKRYFF